MPPTLAPESRWTNLEPSLNAYIQAELVIGAGLDIRFMRQPLSSSIPVRWIELDHTHFTLLDNPKPDQLGRGNDAEWILSLHCFEDITRRTTVYGMLATLDSIRAAFAVDAVIPIYDYATVGNPQVATFKILNHEVVALPLDQDFHVEHQVFLVTLGYSNSVLIP